MADKATYPLRLPKSLKDQVTRVAQRDGTSVNQFIAMAVAEKVSALETEEYFEKRIKIANLKEFRSILYRANGAEPRADDVIERE